MSKRFTHQSEDTFLTAARTLIVNVMGANACKVLAALDSKKSCSLWCGEWEVNISFDSDETAICLTTGMYDEITECRVETGYVEFINPQFGELTVDVDFEDTALQSEVCATVSKGSVAQKDRN